MQQGRWEVLTTLGAMSLRGIHAAMTDRIGHRRGSLQGLCRTDAVHATEAGRRRGDGNLPAHKVAGIRELIASRDAQLLNLLPYSPDLNLIEKAWSKFKKFLRDAKARTKEALDQAVTDAIETITANNAAA
jgi:hypothetical protein